MEIRKDLLEKYALPTLEEFKGNMLEGENETMYYRQVLSATDHIPNKIIEKLIEDLASATALNFITVFIGFIKSVRVDYQEILRYRKYAREEIDRIEVEQKQ